MTIGKPFIGITPGYDYDKQLTYIKPGYIEGIIKAGGIPVLLPVVSDERLLNTLFEGVSGLLLSGGPDVDAVYFGELNLPYGDTISPYRDTMEMYLARKAISERMPLLGICRGMQVMNISMGGTIYQDIASQITDRTIRKHSQQAPKWYPTHEVEVFEGSQVWNARGKKVFRVNSFHHQAVKDIVEGFEITARAPDGIIEAVEFVGHPFAVGVQWHPELMWQEDEVHLGLFKAFVESCK